MKALSLFAALMIALPSYAQDAAARSDEEADQVSERRERRGRDRERAPRRRAVDREQYEDQLGIREDDLPEDDDLPRNVVGMAPLSLLFSALVMEYERAITPSVSAHLAASVAWSGFSVPGILEFSGLSYGAALGARLFLVGEAPEGLWIGPQAGVLHASLSANNNRVSGLGYHGHGMLGYTFMLGPGRNISLSLGLGGGFLYVPPLPSLYVPVVRANIGYGF